MAKGTVKNKTGLLHWLNNSVEEYIRLFQSASLYLAIFALLCCIPTYLYHYRIPETEQTVVLTLVDTAEAELQSLAEPDIKQEFRSRSFIKNSSVLNSDIRRSEHLKEVSPTTKIPSPPIVDETTEPPNNTDVLDEEAVTSLKQTSEESPEVVVIVRAEQKINTEELNIKLEEEIDQPVPEESLHVKDTFTTTPDLNDTVARTQFVDDTRDETTAVILDGLVTSGPTDPHEDIPSFNEWTQKRLEEAEKKKTHVNTSVQTPGGPGRGISGMKLRSKNYASPDCGAKIVATNPEATSAKNILVTTKDEYMLNTCTSRVWFIVELCEAIQAKKIELANFELFSSSPKDFSVYVSDRYPTRDWSLVGQFTAKDVKDVQYFVLHPHFFGKFIKIELHSHYGSEHFCPISLFRTYGTSEFEVLETETENQIAQEASTDVEHDENSDEEELLMDNDGDESPRDLFGSARDAVLRIVKKAAEILVKSSGLTGNNITEIQESIGDDNILNNSYASCMTPRYTIFSGNCSDQKFASVFQLVSCRDRQLNDLLKIDLVNRTLRQGKLCAAHGIKVESSWREKEEKFVGMKHYSITHFDLTQHLQATFLASIFKPEYIIALCNVLATKERRVVMNTSYEIPANTSDDTDILITKRTDHRNEVTSHQQVSATCIPDSNSPACKTVSLKDTRQRVENISQEIERISTSIETSTNIENLASQIKPTKTLSKEDLKKESSIPILESSKEVREETLQAEVLTTVSPPSDLPPPISKIVDESSLPTLGTSVDQTLQTIISVPVLNLDSQESSSSSSISDTESSESSAQDKVDKFENGEQDSKQLKDLNEQEVKLSQDNLSLDTLFSDLKDLESDAANMQNGASSSSSTTQPTATTAPQKESVFLRLSNRIKALERNMSLSGQYLEELSRRYKKQVEEMQRSLERAASAMGEVSRKSEERDARRTKEITALKEEIIILRDSIESIIYDRDSWRSRICAIIQQLLVICLEIVIVILVFSYRRRTENYERLEKIQSAVNKEIIRRKSAENFNSHVSTKKLKKRRPSEIASHINSTYHELMIEDRSCETKKERKKKRKKQAIVNADTRRETARCNSVLDITTTTLPSRRASSVDYPHSREIDDPTDRRPESAPETVFDRSIDNQSERIERIVQPALENKILGSKSEQNPNLNQELNKSNSSSIIKPVNGSIVMEGRVETLKNGSFKASSILNSARLNSPSFMKTALVARKKRKSPSTNERWDSENSNDGSSLTNVTDLGNPSQTISNGNGMIEELDESRSSSVTPTLDKKGKRRTSLKKMVRKFF